MSSMRLQVRDLVVEAGRGGERTQAVRGASLSVAEGQVVGLVGESGSGKTMTSLACLGLLPPGVEAVGGEITVDGQAILTLPERDRRTLRGPSIAMVFQDPLSSFHPGLSIGTQIVHSLRDHGVGRAEAKARCIEVLGEVGLPKPEAQARRYPHQLSGGMRQRAMIALALANRPRILIADEPTTALDPTVQAGILRLLRRLADDGLGLLFISHNLGVVAGLCDEVTVMRNGEVVESGPTARIIGDPQHPYTQTLLAAAPSLPDPVEAGDPIVVREEHGAAASDTPVDQDAAVYTLTDVSRHFVSGSRGRKTTVHALDGISLSIAKGSSTGIVGESGSGKSTLARLLGALDAPSSGQVLFHGQDLTRMSKQDMRAFRRKVQFVFQDPTSSLDPRYTVEDTLREALHTHGVTDPAQVARRFTELSDQVRLPKSLFGRYPRELSGGQRQRVAIARALAPRPEVLIADEPVSSLDVSIQAQVMDVFRDLSANDGLTLVMVSHDLALIRDVCDNLVTLYNGTVMESSQAAAYYEQPMHPYSSALLHSMPNPRHIGRLPDVLALGEPADPTSPPPGCRFHPRCPRAQDLCREQIPALTAMPDRVLACHFPLTVPAVTAEVGER
ncbi:dipeptide ABC transporter ATP-binding protein [Planosporangium mesophilum]|uniref:Peptide ABC transporter ATP-binding protein n=1 Tax=Planosporangium mesophilum TaxID=689768 RepID=A0A8J3T9K3_9ACTN|nr:ABC transporter ATP-binding protein [Planosporangium mesophilum]NJC83898.1 ABC transporter ATP-binding protein [Planosporangium mesophilum]GII22738.1 peptide ABC transporter ATP-binding protein [Planosporangium mesophilum]